MEGGERFSQSHSIEYDLLVLDLICNTRGHYIPILTVVVIVLTPSGHKPL